MNYTKLFYWLTVADNAKTMFVVFMTVFTIIAIISTLWFLFDRYGVDLSCEDNKGAERAKKWMWWSYPFMIVFWSLYVFTPNKKDALLIVAGGQTMQFLTTDSTAKQIPHDVLNFVSAELRSMAKDAEVDLGIGNQKDRLLEEAKKMTTDQLLEKMKADTSFAKVILNQ
jgi:hypothetical protein